MACGCASRGDDSYKAGQLPLPATFSVPDKAASGDVLPVRFENVRRGSNWTVILSPPDGTKPVSAQAFILDAEGGTALALIALPVTLLSGTYSVTASDSTTAETTPLTAAVEISASAFHTEEIRLNAVNTAIRTDTSPEKTQQLEKLSALIASRDETAARFTGPWVVPVSSTRRTSAFADSRLFRYSNGRTDTSTHWGVDFGIPVGTAVFASGNGKVVMAENRLTTGWTVVIEHLPGVYSMYYHLDSVAVSEGQTVTAAEQIARSGNTGLSTGAHLHWEFRVNGVAVSPDWFIGRILH